MLCQTDLRSLDTVAGVRRMAKGLATERRTREAAKLLVVEEWSRVIAHVCARVTILMYSSAIPSPPEAREHREAFYRNRRGKPTSILRSST